MNTVTLNPNQPTTVSSSPKFLEISSNSYRASILTLALKIYRDGYEPDYIVGIGRGGLEIADGLSRLFQKTMGVIMCSSYEGKGEMEQGRLNIAKHISITRELKGKILVVDDLADSGKTLIGVKKDIQENHSMVEDVKTAVIFLKSKSKFTPDYHSEKIDGSYWILLPNEDFDNVLIKHLEPEILNLLSEENLKELSQWYLENRPKNPQENIDKENLNQFVYRLLKR